MSKTINMLNQMKNFHLKKNLSDCISLIIYKQVILNTVSINTQYM